MNAEALRQLRRVVMDAPDDLFHMRAVVEVVPCGTARCALGWAIVDPWFREHTSLSDAYEVDYNYGGMQHSRRVAADVFDISHKDFNNLFGGELSFTSTPLHAVSKEEVLWNIDELLAGRETLPYKATKRCGSPYAQKTINHFYKKF